MHFHKSSTGACRVSLFSLMSCLRHKSRPDIIMFPQTYLSLVFIAVAWLVAPNPLPKLGPPVPAAQSYGRHQLVGLYRKLENYKGVKHLQFFAAQHLNLSTSFDVYIRRRRERLCIVFHLLLKKEGVGAPGYPFNTLKDNIYYSVEKLS